MIQSLSVRITALAARQIREAQSWWSIHRTAAPNAITQELERAFSLLASQPQVGGRAMNVSLPSVRRVFLPRVKYHVYDHVIDAPERVVEVVAFWHARRGDGPPI
ncbi:MAG: type II toxin-antitoxin system RelE/ParE family toxin [Acidobacteria bacterium]|nr:type II toxin-antitoxin system RelE/ParE family toxin [Acidobacteriota bacterium]